MMLRFGSRIQSLRQYIPARQIRAVHKPFNIASSLRSQYGFVLLESIAAMGVVCTALAAGVVSLSTAAKTSDAAHVTANAEWIVASQADFVREAEYMAVPGSYPVIDTPEGFTVSAVAESYSDDDEEIQKVVITVSRNGNPVLVTDVIKVDR